MLPAILLFGIATSLEDHKKGKIRNIWIISAIGYSFFILFTAVSSMLLLRTPLNYSYITDYFVNIGFALSSGFIIWYIGLWSAGDAKLFLAYASLLPLTVYSFGYIPHFPSFIILINTFVPLLAFFFFRIFIQKNIRKRLSKLKFFVNPKNLLSMLISILGISWLIGFVSSLIGIQLDIFSHLFFLLIVYTILEKTLPIPIYEVGIILSILRLAFDFNNIISLQFLFGFIRNVLSFVVIKYLLIELSHDIFTTPVFIENLKPGMVPAEIIYKEGKKYKKKSITFSSLFDTLKKKRKLKPLFEQALKEKDIEKLKILHKKGLFESHQLKVHQMIPFALFMFMGVLLTIIFQGNFLIPFLKLFG
jgi:hypothetical protein